MSILAFETGVVSDGAGSACVKAAGGIEGVLLEHADKAKNAPSKNANGTHRKSIIKCPHFFSASHTRVTV
jgi:hypothetical protein